MVPTVIANSWKGLLQGNTSPPSGSVWELNGFSWSIGSHTHNSLQDRGFRSLNIEIHIRSICIDPLCHKCRIPETTEHHIIVNHVWDPTDLTDETCRTHLSSRRTNWEDQLLTEQNYRYCKECVLWWKAVLGSPLFNLGIRRPNNEPKDLYNRNYNHAT